MPDLTLTTAQIRAIDRLASERYHIPSILLMEHASLALFAEASRLMEQESLRGALILVGPGNNGGDGLALARHLFNAGLPVRVVLTREREGYAGDARVNLEMALAMGVPVEGPSTGTALDRLAGELGEPMLVVDALLGTGVDRGLSGLMGEVVGWVNQRRRGLVLAVDVPSGLHSDRGPVLGACVRADVTVTFVARKPGFDEPGAEAVLGRVIVGSIGAPAALIEAVAGGDLGSGG